MNDLLLKGLCPTTHLRVTLVEVTTTATMLSGRHLMGPTASLVLGEALSAVALLSSDAAHAEEMVTLRLQTEGPIGGLLVEASGKGDLRGYTNAKAIDALDGREEVETTAALGESGQVQILRSQPDKMLNQAVLKVDPPALQTIVARFYNHSMQIPAAVAIYAHATRDGNVDAARAILVERMPDATSAAFVPVLERFHDGFIDRALASGPIPIDQVAELLGLPDLEVVAMHPLQFGCRCSQAKIDALVKTLEVADLTEMVKAGTPHRVTCHMCGHDYSLALALMQAELTERG
jgi:molecular chaperone Hsp33